MVLFVMSVLSVAALSFTYRASLQLRQARQEVLDIQLRAQARSAGRVAMARLMANTNEFDHWGEAWHSHAPLATEDWLPEWQVTSGKEAGFYAEYFVEDEEGKLHLDLASGEALEKLGMTAEQAAALLDWIDGDSVPRSGGAETDFYLGQAVPYRAKDAPVQTLDELLLVRGFGQQAYMGEEIAARLDPLGPAAQSGRELRQGYVSLLTCHGLGRVNINTAPAKVLATLPISPEAVGQILAYRQFDQSSSGGLEQHVFKSEQDIDQLNGLSAADKDAIKALACFRSSHFRIFVLAVHRPSGMRVSLEALVRPADGSVEILQWKM